jgi:hypothetical protein
LQSEDFALPLLQSPEKRFASVTVALPNDEFALLSRLIVHTSALLRQSLRGFSQKHQQNQRRNAFLIEIGVEMELIEYFNVNFSRYFLQFLITILTMWSLKSCLT